MGIITAKKLWRPKNKLKLIKDEKQDSKLEKLQEDLKSAIKEERYEDAAKLRDEIKKHTK